MQTQHFDYIVIGGGSGGYAAARTARESVERVAIIDSADTLEVFAFTRMYALKSITLLRAITL